MRSSITALLFVVVACVSWGMFGPVLHEGQMALGESFAHGGLRPFLCVGIAYSLIAVVAPLVVLWTHGEAGSWRVTGALWSFAAGMVGAVGTLGVVVAFKFHGAPIYVMPLVFGLAPVAHLLVATVISGSYRRAGVPFLVAVAMVGAGAAGVLAFKPASGTATVAFDEFAVMLVAIGLSALCWGSSGPMLYQGQRNMDGSLLRPFLCVGLAYCGIAVLVPLALLEAVGEPGGWSLSGAGWSLAAGVSAAVGALGIVMAFDLGARPTYVMPIVFGCALVVNSVAAVAAEGESGWITLPFGGSLALLVAGALAVLAFAPPREKRRGISPSTGPSEPGVQDADGVADSSGSISGLWGAKSRAQRSGEPKTSGTTTTISPPEIEDLEETIDPDDTIEWKP